MSTREFSGAVAGNDFNGQLAFCVAGWILSVVIECVQVTL
jgi:hypothetical protein